MCKVGIHSSWDMCGLTKLIPGLRELPYEVRLKRLNLSALGMGRIHGNIIEVFNTDVLNPGYNYDSTKDIIIMVIWR